MTVGKRSTRGAANEVFRPFPDDHRADASRRSCNITRSHSLIAKPQTTNTFPEPLMNRRSFLATIPAAFLLPHLKAETPKGVVAAVQPFVESESLAGAVTL